jgi:predicted small secreted protein
MTIVKIRNVTAIFTKLFVVLSIIVSSGCATLEGAGEDIEQAGESIQDAADG